MTQQKIGTFSKSTFFYLILGWTLILVLSGLLRLWAEKADCREIAYNEAVAASERDLAYHAWSAGVGGVYALEGKGSPSPNPFLHVDDRDLTTTDGQTLTLINPEYMMRIVWQEKPRAGAAGVHLVALNPINPVNQADEWETNALHRLAGGAAEVAEQVDLNGTPFFRMVRPMPAGESCRRCHEHLGSGSSQIAGAVSVSLNMSSLTVIHRFNLQQSAIAHLLVWIAGVIILFLIIRYNRREQVAQFSAQEATARAEGALDQIMQNTADGLSIIDRQLRIIRVNKQFCQIAGQTEENIVGKSCHEIFPCSHCDWHECPVHRVLMGESHLERDYDLPDPRTGAIPYRATFFPLRGTGGNIIGVIGQFKNIGDLRQRQQEKEDQIRFLQNVFDALPNPVFYKNAEGRYVIVNDAFFRHLNATREEIIGKTDFELFTLEQAETLREQDEELLAHPGVEMTETTLVVASGATREVLLSRSTLVGPQGDIQGIIGVYLDITSRKRAELALAESESRYRMLFESAADAFFIHGVNQPFLAVNETACTLLGFSRQELWVKTMAELGSPECQPDIAHHMQEMELQGQQVFEATLIRADGNPVPVEINNRQIEYQQKTVILSIVRDISQRKKAEEELKRLVNLLVASNDSLEELNAQISK
ncbi:MAG: PAS domain S-box protein [Myxococcales bacterium]|nr:PAS domain S-box protein [Myxococcales bacterium]